MKYPEFIHKSAFTNSSIFGFNVTKWLIAQLAKVGITTTDICCEDDTIDSKIAANVTDIAALETQLGSYTEYNVLLSQTGTSAPTAKVLNKTIAGTATLGYTSAGLYTLTMTGKFTADKTQIIFLPSQTDTIVYAVRTDANTVTLNVAVASTAVATNAKITDSTFIVRVYA